MIKYANRIFIILLSLISLALFSNCAETKQSSPSDPIPATPPERITFTGIGSVGIFDPSMEKDPNSSRLWLTFSAVDPSTMWPAENHHAVTTHLAHSDDSGQTWTYDKIINTLKDVDITVLTPPLNKGTWHNETSSLVYDSAAPSGEKWKLFWHRYLLIDYAKIGLPSDYEGRHFEHGWISFKQAASPDALDAASEVKLFGATSYDTGNNNLNNPTLPPVGGAPTISLSSAVPELNGCAVYAEPGAIYTNNKLFLALTCVMTSPSVQFKVALLSCNSPCDPTQESNWSFVRFVVSDTEAQAMGYTHLNGADLFKGADGKLYLSISPVGNTPYVDSYKGCKILEFENIETGQLVTAGSTPKVIFSYNAGEDSFNGACTYDAAATFSGILLSQLVGASGEMFRLYKTFLKF